MKDLSDLVRNILAAVMRHALDILDVDTPPNGIDQPHLPRSIATSRTSSPAGPTAQRDLSRCGTLASDAFQQGPTAIPSVGRSTASCPRADETPDRIAVTAATQLARFIDDPRLTDRHVDDHIARLVRLENQKRRGLGLMPIQAPDRGHVLRLARQARTMRHGWPGASLKAGDDASISRHPRTAEPKTKTTWEPRDLLRGDPACTSRVERTLQVLGRESLPVSQIEAAIERYLGDRAATLSSVIAAIRLAEHAESMRRKAAGMLPLRRLSETAIRRRLGPLRALRDLRGPI